MKKSELADDIQDLRWRVEKLEAVSEKAKETRDAEIANMKTVHEVSAFWRMRADDLQKKLAAPSVQGERISELEQTLKRVREERDAFAKQARELRAKDSELLMRGVEATYPLPRKERVPPRKRITARKKR